MSSISAHTLSVAGHNLDPVGLCEFHHLPELHIVQHQCPDIVTEAVRVQLGRLECDPALDTVRQGCVDGLIELQQDLHGQTGSDLAVLMEEK